MLECSGACKLAGIESTVLAGLLISGQRSASLNIWFIGLKWPLCVWYTLTAFPKQEANSDWAAQRFSLQIRGWSSSPGRFVVRTHSRTHKVSVTRCICFCSSVSTGAIRQQQADTLQNHLQTQNSLTHTGQTHHCLFPYMSRIAFNLIIAAVTVDNEFWSHRLLSFLLNVMISIVTTCSMQARGIVDMVTFSAMFFYRKILLSNPLTYFLKVFSLHR